MRVCVCVCRGGMRGESACVCESITLKLGQNLQPVTFAL